MRGIGTGIVRRYGAAPPVRERAGLVALVALLLILAPLSIVAETRLSGQLVSQPPAFDHFLSAVDSVTPSTARLLVVDGGLDPHDHLFTRSVYDLYPRRVLLYAVAADDIRAGVSTLSWGRLLRAARRRHAGYVVVWALPASPSDRSGHLAPPADPWNWALPMGPRGAPPAASVRLREGWGTLVRVAL